MKKCGGAHGPKFDSLGAGSQNDISPAKMLKIEVFDWAHPRTSKIFTFFQKTLVWDNLVTFKPVPGCLPDITQVLLIHFS